MSKHVEGCDEKERQDVEEVAPDRRFGFSDCDCDLDFASSSDQNSMNLLARAPLRCPIHLPKQHHVRCLATGLRDGTSQRRAAENLPTIAARTRFAPSPTGYLHLGSLRTAVFNYLVAKATGGKFVLRVEDTDQKRTVPDAYEKLYRDLRWAGLQWDEGPEVGGPYGPYIQSERKAIYSEAIEQLLKTENVYRCFCSAERLQELAKSMTIAGAAGSYDRKCVLLSAEEARDRADRGEAHVVRLKIPADVPEFQDLTYGRFREGALQQSRRKKLAATEAGYDDPVIVKSDGLPTYHLANVVDDHHMKITHVVRAAEWLASTPKHIALYQAFGWEPPVFAHVGLLLDSQRQKLSKRTGSQDVQSLREQEILPEALVNHLALLGWSHRFNDDFLPMSELVKSFDLKFTKGNVIVNDSKLSYLQSKHFAARIDQDAKFLTDLVSKISATVEEPCNGLQPLRSADETKEFVRRFLSEQPDRYTSAKTFVEKYFDLFYTRACTEPDAAIGDFASAMIKTVLLGLGKAQIQAQTPWTIPTLKIQLDGMKKMMQLMLRMTMRITDEITDREFTKLYWTSLRWAIFRGGHGLTVPEIMCYLGREETVKRLNAASDFCKEHGLETNLLLQR